MTTFSRIYNHKLSTFFRTTPNEQNFSSVYEAYGGLEKHAQAVLEHYFATTHAPAMQRLADPEMRLNQLYSCTEAIRSCLRKQLKLKVLQLTDGDDFSRSVAKLLTKISHPPTATALILAALLAEERLLYWDKHDLSYATPLHKAVEIENKELVALLLALDANTTIYLKSNKPHLSDAKTPLQFALHRLAAQLQQAQPSPTLEAIIGLLSQQSTARALQIPYLIHQAPKYALLLKALAQAGVQLQLLNRAGFYTHRV